MAGINRSGQRPKVAKHLRTAQQKTFVNRTKEEREREHAATDAWAERERLKEPERAAEAAENRRRIRREIAQTREEEWT